MSGDQARKQTAIRLSDHEKREIERRAQAHSLSLSEYMRRCSLGELEERSTLEERVERLERDVSRRLEKLERLAWVGGN